MSTYGSGVYGDALGVYGDLDGANATSTLTVAGATTSTLTVAGVATSTLTISDG